MNILAIDCSTDFLSVALLHAGTTHVREEQAPRQGSGKILSMTQGLLQSAGLALTDLHLLAWSAGPGSFTGLRMGASVVQALCYGSQLPVLSLSSLAVMAEAIDCTALVGQYRADKLAVVMDARMGDVYWASFALDGNGKPRRTADDCLRAVQQLSESTNESVLDSSWLLAGDASGLLGEAGVVRGARVVARSRPLALAALMLAQRSSAADWLLRPEQCVPFYVRNEVHWKKRTRFQ